MKKAQQDLAAIKQTMRHEAEERRAEAAAAADAAAPDRLAQNVLDAVTTWPGAIVSAYWPMRDELDPLPALKMLGAKGHPTCLPVVIGNNQPLVFRSWKPDQPLVTGVFGTSEPPPEAPEVEPDLLLVPLLAFDRRGYRLGYGGGFYDRTLVALRARKAITAVGIAFAKQEVPEVPHDELDQRVDLIATEAGICRPE
ncbi:MAG TPA: 5-formyltetrahydrofolate cyclo-ligase [Kiloniellales bacterium]|nr:5-formyltetrahydrofolate cyclo-ligase [Kiloniellales bacterium]